MTYRTHKAAGCLAMLLAYGYLSSKGLLSNQLNPLVQLAIMYPASSFGSIVPDDDLASIPEKTPFNLMVGKLVHATGAKHRSWQTHSVLIDGGICALAFALTYSLRLTNLNIMDLTVLRLIIVGFAVGLMSHLIMDSITTAGVYLVPNVKFKLVPSWHAFATGGTWENIVRVVLYISIVACIVLYVYKTYFGSVPLPFT